MDIKEALRRFEFRLSSGHTFKPNTTDVKAYNAVVDYVQEKNKKQIIDNELFARMYIHMLNFMLIRYDATLYDDIPQKELHRILDRSTREVMETLLDTHNQIELGNSIEKDKDYEPMTYEEISDNVKAMINGAINTYSPKHLERI